MISQMNFIIIDVISNVQRTLHTKINFIAINSCTKNERKSKIIEMPEKPTMTYFITSKAFSHFQRKTLAKSPNPSLTKYLPWHSNNLQNISLSPLNIHLYSYITCTVNQTPAEGLL